jgi:serine/threonine-protein kinase
VLATPWASIAIDGQPVDVTPIAAAIPLAPGEHFVTFTHPNAATLTRQVTIQAGATVSLDVTMDVAADAGGDAPED